MKISIVIPSYNRAHIIGETLRSLVAQTSAQWEAIIVDDHSTDNSDEVVQNFIDNFRDLPFKYFKNVYAKGAQGARNTGIDNAVGTHVMFLDSDDLLLPECIANRIATINNHPEFDYFCFNTNALLPNGEVKEKYSLSAEGDDVVRFLTFKNPWHTMGCVLKKSCFSTLGKWDEKLTRLQDCDFYLRLVLESSLKGYKAYDLPPDSLFRADYSNDTISKSKSFQKHEVTYLHYMSKFYSLLKEKGKWETYKKDFLAMVFYMFSSFVSDADVLNQSYLNFYIQLLKDFNVEGLKLSVYKSYFKNRWTNEVKNSKVKTIVYKILPRIFKVPYSEVYLW